MLSNFNKSLLFIVLILSSCISKKQSNYTNVEFKKNEPVFEAATIQKNDILDINISALDLTATLPFSKSIGGSYSSMEQRLIDGYEVNDKGFINLPFIGDTEVHDLTPEQASQKIQKSLEEFIVDPIVNTRIINYKITILGEVNVPGTFKIYDQKLSLFQALGMAGDITVNGKKRKVRIIRKINGNLVNKTIDISKPDFIDSEYYYVKKNDVIYVESNFSRRASAGYFGNLSSVTSLLSFFISILLITNNN